MSWGTSCRGNAMFDQRKYGYISPEEKKEQMIYMPRGQNIAGYAAIRGGSTGSSEAAGI